MSKYGDNANKYTYVNVVFVRILVPDTKGNGANGAFKLINQMFIYVKN